MAAFTSVQAQNVQLHYDLGHNLSDDLKGRPAVTTTVEMFKPDKWGSTFLFTDIDYKNDGVVGAYWEIAREFAVSKNKRWAAHIEYNGGALPASFQWATMAAVSNTLHSLVVLGTGRTKIFQRLSACN